MPPAPRRYERRRAARRSVATPGNESSYWGLTILKFLLVRASDDGAGAGTVAKLQHQIVPGVRSYPCTTSVPRSRASRTPTSNSAERPRSVRFVPRLGPTSPEAETSRQHRLSSARRQWLTRPLDRHGPFRCRRVERMPDRVPPADHYDQRRGAVGVEHTEVANPIYPITRPPMPHRS